ncbi:MAG: hypothetical protein LBN32_02140 [Helicobacteraceae bacterium]|nr:hypothetical protein [Helicobacteraceae bacterium]
MRERIKKSVSVAETIEKSAGDSMGRPYTTADTYLKVTEKVIQSPQQIDYYR